MRGVSNGMNLWHANLTWTNDLMFDVDVIFRLMLYETFSLFGFFLWTNMEFYQFLVL